MRRYKEIETMLIASITFTFFLLVIRLFNTGIITYFFYVWNIFLGVIPLLLSRRLLLQRKLNAKSWCFILGWLLFFPNAPYVITDLFHYTERPPVPKWFDLLVVTSAAWNGLVLGIISLMQVENFLLRYWKKVKVNAFVLISFVLCSYGIYIGRFLRFNSWDILTDPIDLVSATCRMVLLPHEYIRPWAFTFLFSVLLMLVYYTVKKLAINDKSRRSLA